MATVPSERVAKLEFYEAHIEPWQTNAVAIGVTSTAVTALSTAAVDARAAYTAHVAAQAAAKAATATFYEKIRVLHNAPGYGADMIQQIKNKATTTNNPGVYDLAQIPAPAIPSPVPAPGTPTDFTVNLMQDGTLELKWKCPNPSGAGGTIYQLQRRAGAATEWTFVGAAGVRRFVDQTIPAGSSPVTYRITAVRSTAAGNPAQFTVNFGAGGVASVERVVSAGVKIAA
jgi:hypothetical protein